MKFEFFTLDFKDGRWPRSQMVARHDDLVSLAL